MHPGKDFYKLSKTTAAKNCCKKTAIHTNNTNEQTPKCFASKSASPFKTSNGLRSTTMSESRTKPSWTPVEVHTKTGPAFGEKRDMLAIVGSSQIYE